MNVGVTAKLLVVFLTVYLDRQSLNVFFTQLSLAVAVVLSRQRARTTYFLIKIVRVVGCCARGEAVMPLSELSAAVGDLRPVCYRCYLTYTQREHNKISTVNCFVRATSNRNTYRPHALDAIEQTRQNACIVQCLLLP